MKCYLRPHVREFLHKAAETYNLILFTAAKENYGSKVVQILDPCGSIFKKVLFRDGCLKTQGDLITKDLR